ncbi:terminase small subunit [Pseudomonas syringae group sp. J309-1]|uniref:terminase small subunit n=1 Tax=Pseudomonas syringae group sp. J309-1 TaxID=3079588 RepID=UPI00290EB1F6|nr:terminase small subunit [Pseudomonas syringae group sp. J309-1]MDU8357994.1 terminase small subunit [Pseudomonas syringae group sp. J309-1]
MALTSKKRAFIVAVREGASNKEAAIAAGCSAKTASAAGSRLAKDADVVRELHKLNALFPLSGHVKADVNPAVKQPRTKSGPSEPKPAGEYVPQALRRPPETPDQHEPEEGIARVYTDPKDYLLDDMNDTTLDRKDRRDAAKALMPFLHARKGEGGKKEERQDAAKKAGAGKFGAAPPPPTHLRSVN